MPSPLVLASGVSLHVFRLCVAQALLRELECDQVLVLDSGRSCFRSPWVVVFFSFLFLKRGPMHLSTVHCLFTTTAYEADRPPSFPRGAQLTLVSIALANHVSVRPRVLARSVLVPFGFKREVAMH
eukprot:3305920-Alexandrium_andersonii.AAC.1